MLAVASQNVFGFAYVVQLFLFLLPILSLKYILYVCGCVECMVRIIRNESIILQLCFAIRRAIKLYTTPGIVCKRIYCWHPALC